MKPALLKSGTVLGAVGFLVFVVFGYAGLLIFPLQIARDRPDVPLARNLDGLRDMFPDALSFMIVYILIVSAVTFIFMVGIQIAVYAIRRSAPNHPVEGNGGQPFRSVSHDET
jgi:Ca2+/Na+ antiporter